MDLSIGRPFISGSPRSKRCGVHLHSIKARSRNANPPSTSSMSTHLTALPDIQKAWVSAQKGYPPSKSLELRRDWPVLKEIKPDQVTVKIQAVALNPMGWKLMRYLPNWIAKRPWVVEYDLAGSVVQAGNSSGFKEGDDVYGIIDPKFGFATKQGALQEYVTLPAKDLAKRPSNISPVEAAGITITAMTAVQVLNDTNLEEGQTIFINGGSTSVGAWAIQLAKLRGAKVVATCSKRNEEYVRSLGADEVIDYTAVGPLHSYLTQNPPSTRYNVVLEAVGLWDSSLYSQSAAYLQPNGFFATVGPLPHEFTWGVVPQLLTWVALLVAPRFLTRVQAKGQTVSAGTKAEDMELVRRLLEEGKIKPTVDSVYEFDDAVKAFDRIITGRARGKVVVNVSLPQTTGLAPL
ncbi:hypothetical protein D9611_004260 [Ephemerocybe angulata]|uniref:Enoyl reductase (ER) domain-containing protein n=1 Tax=Ephemerocybe angulata TaxID=980116 RepID=A0A8H5BJJ1_9AGAR|nr:hypothetical protein D9611_004260 [Tulosesus angulatus]